MGAALKSSNKGLVSRRALSKAASTSFVHGIGICTSRSQSPEFAVGFQHSIIVAVLPLCPQLLPEYSDCSSHLDDKTRAGRQSPPKELPSSDLLVRTIGESLPQCLINHSKGGRA